MCKAFFIYQDEPDYLEDCTGDEICTTEGEVCVAELIKDLFKECSRPLENPALYPLWQECFCLNETELTTVTEAEVQFLPTCEESGIHPAVGDTPCFETFPTFLEHNSATVSIYLF